MPIDILPTPLRYPARRVRDWLLTNAPVLVIVGLTVIIRAVSYSPFLGAPPARGTHPAEAALPMNIWAVIWIITGVVILCAAVKPTSFLAALSLGAGIGLHVVWGLSFLLSTWQDNPRGYVSAVGYLGISALVAWAVWRGRAGQVRRHE